MLFCDQCATKACHHLDADDKKFPKSCPSFDEKISAYIRPYQEDASDRLIARESSLCSPDHSEGRILKTIRFAKHCGYHKLGLAFCVSLRKEAMQLGALLRKEGFEVCGVSCKIGSLDRSEILDIEPSRNAMCNPIGQAEVLNAENTDFNIILGLCVGHDTLFIRHSKAPVTVIAAKDHVYDNAPLEYLKEHSGY